MPRRRSTVTNPLDMLSEFTTKLEQQKFLPNINRYVPMPEQELFHQSQVKNRLVSGGNRGGKTYSSVADDMWILTRKHPYRSHLYPPMGQQIRMRLIGVDFDRGVEQGLLPLVKQFLPPSMLINGSWEDSYSKSTRILTLDDGAKSTVSFMSYEQDQDKFQIVSLHHIHFDEEPPKAIFDESMLRLLDTDGTWTMSQTPVQQMEWIEDEIVEPALSGERRDVSIHYLETRRNVHLSRQAVADLEQNLSANDAAIRLSGQYTGQSLVFPEFKRSWPYLISEEGFRLTPDWSVYESMDHGYVNPTAWLWTAVHPDGSIVTFDMLYGKGVVVDEWAELVKRKRVEICDKYGLSGDDWTGMYRGAIGDPAIGDEGNSTAQTGITIQQAYGMKGVHIATEGIRSARSQNQNIGLDKIHMYLRPRPGSHPTRPNEPWWQMVEETCSWLAVEMKQARKPKQSMMAKQTTNEAERIRDKNNHAIDAIKYLFILTHDLRPAQYVEEEERDVMRIAAEHLRPVGAGYSTHDDVARAAGVSGVGLASDTYYPTMED